MEHFTEILSIASGIITVASMLCATLGLHKQEGALGKLGRVIKILALGVGHAK